MAFLLVVVLLVLCIAIATTRRKTKQPSSAFPLSNLPDAIQAKIVQSHLDTKSRVAFAIAKKDGFDNPQDLKKALYTQDPKRVQCLELLCQLGEGNFDTGDLFITLANDHIEIDVIHMGSDDLLINNFIASSNLEHQWFFTTQEIADETGVPNAIHIYHNSHLETRVAVYNMLLDIFEALNNTPTTWWSNKDKQHVYNKFIAAFKA